MARIAFVALAVVLVATNALAVDPVAAPLPDSTARQQFKTLSNAALKEIERESKNEIRAESLKLPYNANAPKRPAAENVQRLEEIRVFANGDPEDYAAQKAAPMLVFRAQLDKQRPMSAKEITQLGMCIIGLCGIYKPDGSPYELSAVDRAEDRKNATTLELARVRGTLQ